MNRPLNLVRIIGALALSLALGLGLSGCSAIKLGYDSLPQLAYWWLDGYFDFNDAQSPRVREALSRLQQWHRSQELPQYVELLRQAEKLAPGDITAAQACQLVEAGMARLQPLADQAEPVMADIALAFTPAQLTHLSQRHERNNADFRKEWITPPAAEVRERRIKQLTDRFERAYSRLEPAQVAVLRLQVEAHPFDAARTLAERQRRQAQALQALRQVQAPGTPPAEARRQVRLLLAQVTASADPAWRRQQEAMLQQQCALVAAVHNAATPAQREQLARRLRAWQRALGDLAAAAQS